MYECGLDLALYKVFSFDFRAAGIDQDGSSVLYEGLIANSGVGRHSLAYKLERQRMRVAVDLLTISRIAGARRVRKGVRGWA